MFYGITDLATFLLGTIFIVLLPGPNSLYVMSVASRWGVGAGYRGACVYETNPPPGEELPHLLAVRATRH